MRAGLTGLARALARPPGARDPYWTFERWMGEEERHRFRSSFYFCPTASARRHEYDPLYRLDDRIGYEGRSITVTELLGEIERRGHEVGVHGSYLSHRDAAELSRQRAQLATGASGAPLGIRQHFLRFDVRSTWAAQAAAGFAYDTTLGYNEAIGFRAGIAAPFVPWDMVGRKPHPLWELPLTAMDGALFRTLKLDAEAASELMRRHLEVVEAAGGLAVLLWHPNAADERRFPGWWRCYERTLEWLAGRPAWVAPAGAVARWWAGRSAKAGNGGTPGGASI
jgi:peptidoglycan/xylan/chitin deacetylase (PgdA/CDA1 family)